MRKTWFIELETPHIEGRGMHVSWRYTCPKIVVSAMLNRLRFQQRCHIQLQKGKTLAQFVLSHQGLLPNRNELQNSASSWGLFWTVLYFLTTIVGLTGNEWMWHTFIQLSSTLLALFQALPLCVFHVRRCNKTTGLSVIFVMVCPFFLTPGEGLPLWCIHF